MYMHIVVKELFRSTFSINFSINIQYSMVAKIQTFYKNANNNCHIGGTCDIRVILVRARMIIRDEHIPLPTSMISAGVPTERTKLCSNRSDAHLSTSCEFRACECRRGLLEKYTSTLLRHREVHLIGNAEREILESRAIAKGK